MQSPEKDATRNSQKSCNPRVSLNLVVFGVYWGERMRSRYGLIQKSGGDYLIELASSLYCTFTHLIAGFALSLTGFAHLDRTRTFNLSSPASAPPLGYLQVCLKGDSIYASILPMYHHHPQSQKCLGTGDR